MCYCGSTMMSSASTVCTTHSIPPNDRHQYPSSQRCHGLSIICGAHDIARDTSTTPPLHQRQRNRYPPYHPALVPASKIPRLSPHIYPPQLEHPGARTQAFKCSHVHVPCATFKPRHLTAHPRSRNRNRSAETQALCLAQRELPTHVIPRSMAFLRTCII
ncbi:hypothetical protein BD779DRAFT_1118357 [Infundibulicybe gibba]|nr:hypothetical protein BD779DRAFT_1118357 [Infundibulicybe gibba]